MSTQTDLDREYWRQVLLAGGSTAIPQWTTDPVDGPTGQVYVRLIPRGVEVMTGNRHPKLAPTANAVVRCETWHAVVPGFVDASQIDAISQFGEGLAP